MLSQLQIHPSANELHIPLKEEMKGRYIFRRYEKTSAGFSMSLDKPISPGMMGGWVKRVGELLGFERNTICYNLRYMAGNNLDQQGKSFEFPFIDSQGCERLAYQVGRLMGYYTKESCVETARLPQMHRSGNALHVAAVSTFN